LKRPDRFTRQHEAFEAFVVIGGFMHTQQIIVAHPDIRRDREQDADRRHRRDVCVRAGLARHLRTAALPRRGLPRCVSAFGSIWIAPMSAALREEQMSRELANRVSERSYRAVTERDVRGIYVTSFFLEGK
jgi:hypothetical protein